MMPISECSVILTHMTAFDQEPRVKSWPNHIYFPQISGRSLIDPPCQARERSAGITNDQAGIGKSL